jgi:hypothetical protein
LPRSAVPSSWCSKNGRRRKVIAIQTQETLRLVRAKKKRFHDQFMDFKMAAAQFEASTDDKIEQTQMGPFASTQDFMQGSLGLDSGSEDGSISAGGSSPAGGSIFRSVAPRVPAEVLAPSMREASRPVQRKRKSRWGPPTQATTNAFFAAKKTSSIHENISDP